MTNLLRIVHQEPKNPKPKNLSRT